MLPHLQALLHLHLQACHQLELEALLAGKWKSTPYITNKYASLPYQIPRPKEIPNKYSHYYTNVSSGVFGVRGYWYIQIPNHVVSFPSLGRQHRHHGHPSYDRGNGSSHDSGHIGGSLGQMYYGFNLIFCPHIFT